MSRGGVPQRGPCPQSPPVQGGGRFGLGNRVPTVGHKIRPKGRIVVLNLVPGFSGPHAEPHFHKIVVADRFGKPRLPGNYQRRLQSPFLRRGKKKDLLRRRSGKNRFKGASPLRRLVPAIRGQGVFPSALEDFLRVSLALTVADKIKINRAGKTGKKIRAQGFPPQNGGRGWVPACVPPGK